MASQMMLNRNNCSSVNFYTTNYLHLFELVYIGTQIALIHRLVNCEAVWGRCSSINIQVHTALVHTCMLGGQMCHLPYY